MTWRRRPTRVRRLHGDLEGLLGEEFRREPPPVPSADEVTTEAGLHFLQEYFFLILFRSIFAALGVSEERLHFYTELNFCIKGTITAADNIFDDQAKTLLPLAEKSGSRFMSILQLMSFERLLRGVLDRGEAAGVLTRAQSADIQRGLLDRMAAIGTLEGSEEGGVDDIPPPDEMLEEVHRVRGGALFALAFTAPGHLEEGDVGSKLAAAESSVAQLGTAFQIVDDLTDFEFDVGRRSHNLLVSQIHHLGSGAERAAFRPFWTGTEMEEGDVEHLFAESARGGARAGLRGGSRVVPRAAGRRLLVRSRAGGRRGAGHRRARRRGPYGRDRLARLRARPEGFPGGRPGGPSPGRKGP